MPSLWESWHAIGVPEREFVLLKNPLRPGIRRATSPKGRGMAKISTRTE